MRIKILKKKKKNKANNAYDTCAVLSNFPYLYKCENPTQCIPVQTGNRICVLPQKFKKKKKTKNKMVIRNHVDEDGTTTHRKKLRHNHEDYALFDRLVFHWRRQYIALFHGVLLFF